MNIAEKLQSLEACKRNKFLQKIKFDGTAYGIYPLTPNQYSIWCKYQISNEQTDFTNPCLAITLHHCSETLLQTAVKQLFVLEEVFQYQFFEIDKTVYQYRNPEGIIPLTLTDLSDFKQQTEKIQERKHQFYITPFHLTEHYPVRFEMLKLSETDWILLFCMHHIIADAASVGVVLHDLYALLDGKVPKKSCSYGAYAIEKNHPNGMQQQMEQEQYWINKIANVEKQIEFPTDFLREESNDLHAGIVDIELSGDVLKDLKAIEQQTKVNAYVVLSSLFSILLHHFTEKKSWILATTFFNRNDPNYLHLVGDFASIVPNVYSYPQNQTLFEYLQANQSDFLDAMDHSDVVFSRISDAYQNCKREQVNPIYQTAMVYHKKDLIGMNVNQIQDITISVEDLSCESNLEHFEIDLYAKVTDFSDRILISFLYQKRLFRRETIENLATIYQKLLQNALRFLQQPLWKIPLEGIARPTAVSFCRSLTAVAPSKVLIPESATYMCGEQKICVLDEHAMPLPPDFYGMVYLYKNEVWYETGKKGRVRQNGTLEINEQRSWYIDYHHQPVDLKKAIQNLQHYFPEMTFQYQYPEPNLLILQYASPTRFLSESEVAKAVGFLPDLIYHTADPNQTKLLKHQKNILLAKEKIQSLGYETTFRQREQTDAILFHGAAAPSKDKILKIESAIQDESILFQYSSQPLQETTEELLFTYRKRERSQTEETMFQIWAEILHTTDFHIYDNFYDVGGDSLKIYELMQQIETVFRQKINIANLFQYNSVAALSEYIDRKNQTVRSTETETETLFF